MSHTHCAISFSCSMICTKMRSLHHSYYQYQDLRTNTTIIFRGHLTGCMSHVTIRPSVCINSVVNCGLIGEQYNVVLSQQQTYIEDCTIACFWYQCTKYQRHILSHAFQHVVQIRNYSDGFVIMKNNEIFTTLALTAMLLTSS